MIMILIRFQSKYHNQVVEETSAGKASHLTMGEAESYLAPPDRYLRKHTGTGGNHIRAKSARTHSKAEQWIERLRSLCWLEIIKSTGILVVETKPFLTSTDTTHS